MKDLQTQKRINVIIFYVTIKDGSIKFLYTYCTLGEYMLYGMGPTIHL